MYTCTAQVVSPWQAFITVLLRNHIIDLLRQICWESDSWCTVSHSLILPLKLGVEAQKMTLDPLPSRIQVIFCSSTPLYWHQIFRRACILAFVTPASQCVAAVMLLGNTRPLQPGPHHICPYSRGKQRPTSAAKEEPTQMKPNPAAHLQLCWAGKLAGPLLSRSSGCFSHVI